MGYENEGGDFSMNEHKEVTHTLQPADMTYTSTPGCYNVAQPQTHQPITGAPQVNPTAPKGASPGLILAGVGLLVLLPLVMLGVFFLLRKKKPSKPTDVQENGRY